ncbi:DUF5687 family protein [Salinibacter sp.]|uniref:DUF5687 family protein n=1 Tax=Salinibacter sp. TaxID=2065818 RepID=UPI0021E9760B|nr:DUF5687 family protein [Salinibacter sp.]
MSLWSLLRHRLHAFVRVPFVGRRGLSLILGGFLALYLGGGLVLLGVAFDDLVREAAPGADPLLVASRGLLPFVLAYAAVRVFVESGVGADLRPYLPLPVRRSGLVAVLAALSLFSLWNAVPLAFVATVCVEAALDGALGPALRFGLAGAGVLVAVTYATPMLRRGVSARPVLAAVGLFLLVASAGLEWVNVAGGVASLLDVSGWLFGGAVQGRVLPVSGAVLGLVGLAGGYARWLRQAMVVDRSQRRSASGGSSEWLSRLARRGPAWREAVLEVRLAWRNPQTRMSVFTAFLLPVMVTAFAFFPIELSDLRSMSGAQLFNAILFPGLFTTGAVAIFHGQNLFSYEGGSIEATVARPVSPCARVAGKLLFLEAGTLACFFIPFPFLLARQSPFLLVHTSFFLYNAGVLVPAIIAGATFNREALTIDERSFSQTNFSGGRIAITFPLFGVPLLFLFSFDRLLFQFGGFAGLGLLSLLAMPLWLRGLARLYEYNRHAMLRGFRASRS